MLTTAFGGNGAIAWEPAAGVVAYVSYSGAEMGAGPAAALHRLAERARPLTDEQWRALSPQIVAQTNAP